MARQKKVTPKDIGNGDYCYMNVTVERQPEIEFYVDDKTGEFQPKLKQRENPVLIHLPILVDPNGVNVFVVNLFMRYLAKQDLSQDALHSHIRALLLFYRWMYTVDKTIYDCSNEQENGVVYLFRDFLVDNLKRDSEVDGELVVEGIYEASTAGTYMGTIIKFYEFLHVERIVRFDKGFVPFEYKTVKVKRRSKGTQHDILGHLKRNDTRMIEVQTTGLKKPFGRVQRVESHHGLSPMREDEKLLFFNYLNPYGTNFIRSDEVKDLMLYTATETGLRLEELVTFPESEVKLPLAHEDVVKATISEVRNGCKTKFDKERTIEVPRQIMDLLFQYKTSKVRLIIKKRALMKHNCLFLSPQQGLPFSPKTIQSYFSSIRKTLIKQHSEWYFTVHDLRATFATHWLYREHQKSGLIFDVLLDELKNLMGHNSIETTQKYIKYMDTDKYWQEFSARKNNFMSNVTE